MAAWSPDGARIVYRGTKQGITSVMIAKTSGQATPVELVRGGSANQQPDWSPTGEWITYSSAPGSWALISPDGKEKRDLGKIDTPHLTFSRDGKTLYGIRAEGEHQHLFSLTIAGGSDEDHRRRGQRVRAAQLSESWRPFQREPRWREHPLPDIQHQDGPVDARRIREALDRNSRSCMDRRRQSRRAAAQGGLPTLVSGMVEHPEVKLMHVGGDGG